MTSSARVVRVTTYAAADGRRGDLVAAAARIGEQASRADGCFGAQLCAVEGQPQVVAALSRWESRESLDSFVAAQRDELGALGSMLAEPAATVVYTAIAD